MAELTQNDEWSGALRSISEQRDRLLGGTPTISSARRATLDAVLAREFPIEAALREAGERRDLSLGNSSRRIPRFIATNLRNCLTNKGQSVRGGWSSGASLRTRPMLLAACLVVGLGILLFGNWESLSNHPRDESLALQQIELGPRSPASRDQLTLRMSAAEMASLRSAFLAVNPTSLDDAQAPTRLRLDLPVRVLFRDEAIASTP